MDLCDPLMEKVAVFTPFLKLAIHICNRITDLLVLTLTLIDMVICIDI